MSNGVLLTFFLGGGSPREYNGCIQGRSLVGSIFLGLLFNNFVLILLSPLSSTIFYLVFIFPPFDIPPLPGSVN